MSYQELYNDYVSLLHDKAACQTALGKLKDGYISTKTISGKKYAYLQYRVNGRLTSEYVKDANVPHVRTELDERVKLNEQIRALDEHLNKIETAAAILDSGLHRKMTALRRSAAMDALPTAARKESLAFGNAMTSLEGIPASAETSENLRLWADGAGSFQESYLNTLRVYHLAEV